jgi:hypothetical protein
MGGWIVRIAIIGVIAVGALIFRDRLSGNAGELKVGDCFDDPSGDVVTDVQHHPCTEAHTAEVIFVGDVAGDQATYPADAVVDDFVEARCLPAWTSYTGKDLLTETVLRLGYYVPSPEGWSDGDREVLCYAAREDGAAMSVSVKKGP